MEKCLKYLVKSNGKMFDTVREKKMPDIAKSHGKMFEKVSYK